MGMNTSSWRRVGASVLVMAVGAAGLVDSAASDGSDSDGDSLQGTQLVTTWGASDDIAGGTLNDMTVRDILRTSVGGSDLRIRLSNANGDQPLVSDSAYVGKQQSGASVVPGSSRRLTFGGKTSVRIPPGAMAISDPLPGPVPAQTSLTVSLHVVGTTGVITAHNRAMQHSYKSTSGDHAADETATAYQTESSAWFFLNAAIVTAPQQVDTVATLGDSITSSVGTTIDTNRRWPDILADRYGKLPEHRRLAISNEGICGRCIVGGTLTPVGGSFVYTPEKEAARQAVNEFIRTSGEFDGVVDFDAATRDPAEPTRLQAAYDGGDGLHPNDAGNFAMGNAPDLDTLRCN